MLTKVSKGPADHIDPIYPVFVWFLLSEMQQSLSAGLGGGAGPELWQQPSGSFIIETNVASYLPLFTLAWILNRGAGQSLI